MDIVRTLDSLGKILRETFRTYLDYFFFKCGNLRDGRLSETGKPLAIRKTVYTAYLLEVSEIGFLKRFLILYTLNSI